MFDAEFFSIVVIFAVIASLVTFLGKRESNWAKKHRQENPARDTSDHEELSLEDWGFPQPSYETIAIPPAQPTPEARQTAPRGMQLEPAETEASASNGTRYQSISESPEQILRRPSQTKRSSQSRFGSRAQLRESIITMTVIGPCRALSPHQEREQP